MSEVLITLLSDMLFAGLAGFGFAYAARPPLPALIIAPLIAAFGHAFRFALVNYFHFEMLAVATFLASFAVGLLGLFATKFYKTPLEVITFPALLPMIPGFYAYRSILLLFEFLNTSDPSAKSVALALFFDQFFITISVTLALAVGVSTMLLVFAQKSFAITRYSNIFKQITHKN